MEIETDEDEEEGEEDWTKIRLRRVDWSWWSLTQQWVRETLGGSGPFAVDEIHAFESVAVPGECEGFMLGDPIARTFDTKGFNQVMLDRARDIMAYGGPYENVMVGSAPRILRELESSARSVACRWKRTNSSERLKMHLSRTPRTSVRRRSTLCSASTSSDWP